MAATKTASISRPVELVDLPAAKTKRAHKCAKLRSSITPGTVLILLAGRFRGKRVVFLKQLPSGLLLVSGPFKVNGVPLKRVNQSYVIATSTKVDISGVKLPVIEDSLFKKTQKKTNKDMFVEGQKKELCAERKKLQTDVDSQLIAAVKAVPQMRSYLASIFTLQKGQAPHAMKF
jgi:large subunit ribosomal protein L6e